MARAALTPKQARFVELYLVSLNATEAYREAYGVGDGVARTNGARMLANARIAGAVQAAIAKRAERTEVTADLVVRQLWLVASADPRDLIELRRHACRYCYGRDHRYQYTPAEFEREKTAWEAKQSKASKETFDERGGIGYSAKKDPHPDCPECHGHGIERVLIHDTRKLSPAAAALYAGVKTTKDGLEVKTHSKEAAWALLARHVGLGDTERGEGDPAEHAKRVRDAVREMDAADGVAA